MKDSVLVNALTVDLEDWYQGLEIPPREWEGFEDRLVPATRLLLQIFAEAGVRATFFVLGEAAERHPDLIREVARAGHEIGTHGFTHTLVYRDSPERFQAGLARSLALLRELSGGAIVGHRAPFFSITRASLWALPILLEHGIRYDSSIFPVMNYRYGIEGAPRWPHEMAVGEGTLMEFPITTWRLLGKNIPVAGGAYFRLYPYAVTRTAYRSINNAGHPVTFYLHPWELDPRHPRIPLPRRIAATHYVNLQSTEGKLRRLLRDFRFAPMKEVLNVV